MKYKLLAHTQLALMHHAQVIGPEYSTEFFRSIDEAIERAWARAEDQRKADNAARLAAMRKESV